MKFIVLLVLTISSVWAQGGGNVFYDPQYKQDLFDIEEIHTRLTTEVLTESQKLAILMAPFKKIEKQYRVQFYADILFDLPAYKLSVPTEIKLIQGAIEEAKVVKYQKTEVGRGFPSPYNTLIEKVMSWVISHQKDLYDQSHQFLVDLLELPGLNEGSLSTIDDAFFRSTRDRQGQELESALPPQDFEFALGKIIDHPVCQDEVIRHSLLNYALENFRSPYGIRGRLVAKLLASRKVPKDLIPLTTHLAKRYAAAAQFVEAMNGVEKTDWVKKREIAMTLVDEQDNAPYLVGIISNWFAKENAPRGVQSEVTSQLVKNLDRTLGQISDDPGNLENDVISRLYSFPIVKNLTPSVQKQVLRFVIKHTQTQTESQERIRYLIGSDFVYYWGEKPIGFPSPITQWTFEQLMENSLPAVPISKMDPNRGNSDKNVDFALELLRSCQDPTSNHQSGFQPDVCKTLTSPAAICQKIINNPNIGKEQRDAAAALLTKLSGGKKQ